jgi:hypothetical protein
MAADKMNLTLYHINELNYTGVTNMNTGDAAGDAFFDLRAMITPMACRDPTAHHYGNECDNPEVFADNLGVTKVVIEVDSGFGTYAMCNVCINSSVPMSKPVLPCSDGDYVCVCHDSHFQTVNSKLYLKYLATCTETVVLSLIFTT